MARKRMIDPSIWTDEGMAELEPIEQLLYIGLFSIADDDGRLKASPTYLRLALPTILGNVDKDQIPGFLANITRHMTKLEAYEVEGVPYLAFRNYRVWQRIDRPTTSVLPAPHGTSSRHQFDEHSTSVRRTVDERSSRIEIEEEKEKKEGEVVAPAARTPTGSRIAEDWQPSDIDRKFARDHGLSDRDIAAIADRFRDHWIAQPGQKGRKSDWAATWRNWIRRDIEENKPRLRVVNGHQPKRLTPEEVASGLYDTY